MSASHALTKDPVLRRLAIVILVLILGLALTAGALIREFANGRQVWATFEPAVIGELSEDGLTVQRNVSVRGVPVHGYDAVPMVFTRCGPDVDLFVRSRRTWTVRFVGVNGEDIERVGGQVIELPIEATPDCFRFQARLDVGEAAQEFAQSRNGVVTVALTLVVEPLDTDNYIAVPVKVEPFEVQQGQTELPDTVVLEPIE